MFPSVSQGHVLAVQRVSLQKPNCSGDAVFTLFLLQTPVDVVVKQSGFNNREGKGADASAGSRSLAMCYQYLLLGGRGVFERALSDPPWESLKGGVRLGKVGS